MELNFRNAQAVISRRLILLEKQQELLQLSKEKAFADVDASFDKIIHVRLCFREVVDYIILICLYPVHDYQLY